MTNLLLVIFVIFISFSSVGAGYLFLRKISINDLKLGLYLSFFSGQILISFVWIIITTFFPKPANLLILMPMLVYLAYLGLKVFASQNFNLSVKNKYDKLLFLILLFIFLFYLFISLTPPFEWDVISYRLPVVEELSLGRLRFPLLQTSPYSNYFTSFVALFGNFPYSSESYFSILYSILKNGSSSHLLNLINFTMFIILVQIFSIKLFKTNLTSNICISILLFLNLGISLILPTGLIDINLAIYQFLSLISVYFVIKNYKFIYLFVIFASYSLAQKYISLFVIIPISIYLIYVLFHSSYFSKLKLIEMLKILMFSMFLFVIAGGYWYIKNFIMYFNPVYPLYFGHRGISDETYLHIMETLVYGLRKTNGFSGLFESIKASYVNETGLILSFIVLVAGLLVGIVKKTRENVFMLVLVISVYLENFFIGSQLTRFILIVPIIIYLLSTQVYSKLKWLGIVIVAISIFFVRLNPLQWSVWSSRFESLYLYVLGRSDELYRKNIGCSYDVYLYLKQTESTALNVWDPYSSLFYKNKNVFTDVVNIKDLKNFAYKDEYLYVNGQYKTSFLSDKNIHRDMFLNERVRFEEELTSNREPVYSKFSCLLYKIK